MTDIERAFLDDIIANPGDDTPRLIFADWLDENGQEERAELIRIMLPHPGLRYRCGPQNPGWWEARWSDPIMILHACEQNQAEWEWRRGFVHTVRCPLQSWRDHGPAIVRQHPVEVVTTGKQPAFRDHGSYPGGWGWFKGGFDATWQTTVKEDIPEELWDILSDDPVEYGWWKFYATEEDALSALSKVLIRKANDLNRRNYEKAQ